MVKTLKSVNSKAVNSNTRKKLKSNATNLKVKMKSKVLNSEEAIIDNKNISKEFIDRMNQPIMTFPGSDISDSEKKIIEQMVKYFEG